MRVINADKHSSGVWLYHRMWIMRREHRFRLQSTFACRCAMVRVFCLFFNHWHWLAELILVSCAPLLLVDIGCVGALFAYNTAVFFLVCLQHDSWGHVSFMKGSIPLLLAKESTILAYNPSYNYKSPVPPKTHPPDLHYLVSPQWLRSLSHSL